MTKGVPKSDRLCNRCRRSYKPTSGPQKYCRECIPIIKAEHNKDWRKKHPEQRRLIDLRALARKPDYYRALKRYCHFRWRENLRRLVLDHYSKGTFECSCCGEKERDFLVIDHMVNGQGNQHRRAIFGVKASGGHRMHQWLTKNGFPEGFQVLCANCNSSKGKHGECVHKVRPREPERPSKSGLDGSRVQARSTPNP